MSIGIFLLFLSNIKYFKNMFKNNNNNFTHNILNYEICKNDLI